MLEKIIFLISRRLGVRLFISCAFAVVPVTITAAMVGSACLNAFTGASVLTLVVTGSTVIITALCSVGMPIMYASERWIVRGRANSNWKWLVARFLMFVVGSVPEAGAIIIGYRIALPDVGNIARNSVFIPTAAGAILAGVLFTLLEQALQVVHKREAQYAREIKELRIEIDQVRQKQQVDEIVENDFFRDLQAKAEEMRHTTKPGQPQTGGASS